MTTRFVLGVILSRAKDLNTSPLPNTNPLTNKPIDILHSASCIQDDNSFCTGCHPEQWEGSKHLTSPQYQSTH
ncbi:MAG: hypothetical protein K9G61_10390 [Bacteroidales bacterium]|nr:hypothetical protein [Bacteroidales bacterium]